MAGYVSIPGGSQVPYTGINSGYMPNLVVGNGYGPPQDTKVDRARSPEGALSGSAIPSLYDVGYDPHYPVSGGFQPGTWATKGETALQAIDTNVPHASGSTTDAKFGYRATPDMRQAYPVDPFRTHSAPAAPSRSIADLYGGLGVAGNALFGFGDPGTTDWSIANQGGEGITGNVRAPYGGAPNTYRRPTPAAPAPIAPPQFGIADLFGSLSGNLPAVSPNDPLQIAVRQAQANGQTYDRSTDPSFNPNSGWGKGNSLAGF